MSEVEKGGHKYWPRRYQRGVIIYFEDSLARRFRNKFDHPNKTRTFPYYMNLAEFLANNPSIELYFSEFDEHSPFVIDGNTYFVNIDSYINFCRKIESSTEGRAQAFFGQHIDHSMFLNEKDRQAILDSVSAEELLGLFNQFDEPAQKTIIENISKLSKHAQPTLTVKQFDNVIRQSASNPAKRKLVIAALPHIQMETLKAHHAFLSANLHQNEKFIQNWIDGKTDDDGKTLDNEGDARDKLRKSRCLIFGLEYIDHKREGSTSQKRFDVLSRISDGGSEYVLFELKSPSGRVFDVDTEPNDNDGTSETYSLSLDVARAIPQISSYKNLLLNGSQTEWQRYGLKKGNIAKSIIMVGTRVRDNEVWNEHYSSLKQTLSSSVEIMTYSDLLDKISVTIKNLEENL